MVLLNYTPVGIKCSAFCLCVDLEMAVAYWNLVLSGRFKFLDLWNRFLLVSQRSEVQVAPIKYAGFVSTPILADQVLAMMSLTKIQFLSTSMETFSVSAVSDIH